MQAKMEHMGCGAGAMKGVSIVCCWWSNKKQGLDRA